jgi:hypothetical protein
MSLLSRFDPPAYLNDFDAMPGMREAWHEFVSLTFDQSIASELDSVLRPDGKPGIVQFYNPTKYDPGGPTVEQAVTWNAFPKELLRRFGKPRALVEADRLWPLSGYRGMYDSDLPEVLSGKPPGVARDVFYRPLVEYCEWRVDRDPLSGAICRVTFTSEPPEYWQALFGQTLFALGDTTLPSVKFPGDPQRVLALYRDLVGPQVELDDLRVRERFVGAEGEIYDVGDYNPYNIWNTQRGIVHLCAPPNSLGAEIKLGADATVLYASASGEPVVHPDALICCAAYGGANRNSDPTIGATVNALARAGAMVTLVNPVGLYMDHIDTSGWELPKGIRASDCVRIVRGAPGMIERLVVEPPPTSGVALSDLLIAGQPLRYGGQLAECITVKLVGGAAQIGAVTGNAPRACQSRCILDAHYPTELLRPEKLDDPLRPGCVVAFELEGGNLGGSTDQKLSVRARADRARITRHR